VNTAARQFTTSPTASHCILPLAGSVDLLALHAANPARYPHLLESVAQGPAQAQFDILFAFPGDSIESRADGSVWSAGQRVDGSSFLAAFDAEWSRLRVQPVADATSTSPFVGGWFVFLAYELISEIEGKLADVRRSSDLPIALATRFQTAVIRDHATGQCSIVCEQGAEELAQHIKQDVRDLARTVNEGQRATHAVVVEEEPADRFLESVRQVKDYIAAGDVFQVNLSRRWHARFSEAVPAVTLYERLRQTNPAPFAALVTPSEGKAILSTSPERLVEVRNGRVCTRPIAGTHPRGHDAQEDTALARALMAHPKERAEHVMLIDLERNDLGRLCVAGSVAVHELMGLETYRHVHHIVSEVRGSLRPEIRPADVIRAVFPGGTITGCPKIRCMEIICEQEAAPRSAYTGSVGYINLDGSMDLNILIRSLILQGREVVLRAGAGIVADSIPQRELEETRAKARGLLDALR